MQATTLDGRRRRSRDLIEGIVLRSEEGGKWLVHFNSISCNAIMTPNQLKFVQQSNLTEQVILQLCESPCIGDSSSVQRYVDNNFLQANLLMPPPAQLPPASAQLPPASAQLSHPPPPPPPLTPQLPSPNGDTLQQEEILIVDDAPVEDHEDTNDQLQQMLDPDQYRRAIMEEARNTFAHANNYVMYEREKSELIGSSVLIGPLRGEKTRWEVCEDVMKESIPPQVNYFKEIGIRDFNFRNNTVSIEGTNYSRLNLLDLVCYLWPGDWMFRLRTLNEKIKKDNLDSRNMNQKIVHPISQNEFWIFFGILLAGRLNGKKGDNNWGAKREGIIEAIDMSKYMKKYRFLQIKKYMSHLYYNKTKENIDPWWQIIDIFDDFNETRKKRVQASNNRTCDESMAAFRPQSRATGNLPHISHIERKPEDLGIELKACACSELQIMLSLEIQRAKDDMTVDEFFSETKKKHTACTLRLLKAASQRSDAHTNLQATEDIVIADAWFGSVSTAVGVRKHLPFQSKVIMNVKTNHSHFPRKYLEDKMSNWPSGSHLVMKATVEDENIYAVGYKYCKSKTLCFIFNEGASSTEQGEPYIAKWKDDNDNTIMKQVNRPEVCSIYFRYNNVIDVHNMMRQKELALEKYWVTECGFFRLLTTVFGMTIVDCWRAYRHHISPNHRHKQIKLEGFIDLVAYDMLHNSFPKTEPELNQTLNIFTLQAAASNDVPSIVQVSASGESFSQLTSPETFHNLLMSRTRYLEDEFLHAEVSKHQVVKTVDTTKEGVGENERTRLKRHRCSVCKHRNRRTVYYCVECRRNNVYDTVWICNPFKFDCYESHKEAIRHTLRESRDLPNPSST
jgi:hypothetical protein